MKRIVTGGQMKQLDSYTIDQIGIPSLVLMERAACSVYSALKEEKFPLERTLVLCGSGNNGADGVAVARMLHLNGKKVDVCIIGNEAHYTPEMRKQIEIAGKYQVPIVKNILVSEYTTIVDAIFGVGLSRNVKDDYLEIIEKVNQSKAKVMAVDIPSGIHADTGKLMGCAVRADVTVTFAYEKAGLLLYPGAVYAGKVITADIGIYWTEMIDSDMELFTYEREDILKIPSRMPGGNKGTFGKIFLAAGNSEMSGAPFLCASAAMRIGAGMIKVHTREENRGILGTMLPEAMYSYYGDEQIEEEKIRQGIAWADVIGIGPGIGTKEQSEEILRLILTEGHKPLVIDADGLNLLKNHMELLDAYEEPVILTPHLGEYARLTGISPDTWKEEPFFLTRQFAEVHHINMICKDARTVISDGSRRICINTSGNSGMATAGSGDVLTGILLGLLAQGMKAQEAASLGVYLHGLAGDMAAGELGEYALTARDIITYAAVILKKRGEVK